MPAVPPAMLAMLQPGSGSAAGMTVASGRPVIEPVVGRKCTLQELLAQCDAAAPVSGEDGAWTASAAAARELV